MITVLSNARIFDGVSENIIENGAVVIEGDRIRDVTSGAVRLSDARVIDCRNRYLIPGLIDCHVHACSPTYNLPVADHLPASLLTSHAVRWLKGALHRGFTSVRDAGGGDVGLHLAIERGVIEGPRFFFSGKALSQTGGHSDNRPADYVPQCGCAGYAGCTGLVVDGADAVRLAVREELRKGATQIKLMLSGGVTSPTDPMWMPQFTDDEILAAVQEAGTRRVYVMAHAHTDDAARRCAALGVRTVEHGTDISPETAALLAEHGTYVVPTLSPAALLERHGARVGLPPAGVEKVKGIITLMARSIENLTRAGVKLGIGTDLFGEEFHVMQGGELKLRGEVSPAIDVLRSATSIGAEILQKSGELGCIRPDALADILVLEGDPFADLGLFEDAARNIPMIMKSGQFVRCSL
ncbi:Imidazolonepropionase [Bradyrhizobium sp. Rc3b]|uniref:metal-dependent hydrolase family protein n=1 Tax=Bradyrhizobium sp. Rc3b TaxID=1855322 RepID=UPI0008E808BC|nr:amidohydrolase family protein [Bradyrhizobium sp. Rc3b]SFM49942.1 Imidazolonepropionase [Bradyrhizobium sp. Rc3b]